MIFQQYRRFPKFCKTVFYIVLTFRKHQKYLLIPGLIVSIWMPAIPVFSQSAEQLRYLASTSFESQHYREAARYYGRLLEIFPRDARYQYLSAVSLIRSDTSYHRAIELLSQPQVKAQYPDASFQIGEAYRQSFLFHEADGQYANIIADKSCDKALREQAEKSRHMNAEAQIRTSKIYALDFYEYADISGNNCMISSIKKGNLFRWSGPEASYLERYRLVADSSVYMQDVEKVQKEYPAFFVARSGKKEDLNLYRARIINEKGLGVPLLLDFTVNSKEDEGFAWFDVTDSILYFSSKGHSSMGGYDLFSSRMNPGGLGWSKPVALGFPLNTCADELALIILPDRKSAVLITNRFNGGNHLTSCIIRWPLVPLEQEESNPGALLALARKMHTVPWPVETDQKTVTEKPITLNSVAVEAGKTEVQIAPMEENDDAGYMELLNEALQLQLRADSLLRETEAARKKLALATDPKERQRLQQDIKRYSTLADQVQGQANSCYSRAREMELKYVQQVYPDKRMAGNVPTPKTTSGNQAERNVAQAGTGVQPGPVSGSSPSDGGNTDITAQKTDADSFLILSSCPYSEKSPIPEMMPNAEGVIYHIQMGVFSKPIAPDRFGGISPLMFEKVPESGLTRFYAGKFASIVAAEKALQQVKTYGFKEAYLVSFFQGKKISLIRARELEQLVRSSN